MKKLCTLTAIVAALVLTTSCGSENNCAPIEKELNGLKNELSQRDSVLDEFGRSMDIIDSNLTELSSLEQALSADLSEKGARDNESIESNVSRIRDIMQLNKDYIGRMQSTASANAKLASNLIGIIETMEYKVMQGNLRLARHNAELEGLGDDFKDLFQEYIDTEMARMQLEENLSQMEGNMNMMEDKMRELKNSLNTAYFVIGQKKELIDKGVLEKGGLMQAKGINENVDKTAFTDLDVRETKEINLGTDKYKLITEHPSNSYKIVNSGDKTSIEITDKEAFWSLSKYLVVMTN